MVRIKAWVAIEVAGSHMCVCVFMCVFMFMCVCVHVFALMFLS